MVAVILVIGAFLVAAISAVTGHRPEGGKRSVMGLTLAGFTLVVLAIIIMVGGVYKEITTAAEAASREQEHSRHEEQLLAHHRDLAKKNEDLLRTLGDVELKLQLVATQVASIERQTKLAPPSSDLSPPLEALAGKLNDIRREIRQKESANSDASPGGTVTEAAVLGPTGPAEYTLEARVTPRGKLEKSLRGAVVFFLNGRELRPSAPLIGDKARLIKVEMEKGVNRVAAQFIPSPDAPDLRGSRSELIQFEVK